MSQPALYGTAIVTVPVPLLFITHALAFRLLLKRDAVAASRPSG